MEGKKKLYSSKPHIDQECFQGVQKYLLMCLFLLAVRNTPDKQNLFGLSGSAGGV